MPREAPEKAVEAFIDELDMILFDSAEEDKLSDEEKVKRVKNLCAEVRLAIMLEGL